MQKETQYQLATALCPGKDKIMIFKKYHGPLVSFPRHANLGVI